MSVWEHGVVPSTGRESLSVEGWVLRDMQTCSQAYGGTTLWRTTKTTTATTVTTTTTVSLQRTVENEIDIRRRMAIEMKKSVEEFNQKDFSS